MSTLTTPPKREKLTVMESRSRSFCEDLNRNNGGTVAVKWKPSRAWGSNPVISTYSGKCCCITGCGYDKLSTALAEVLRFLFPIGSDAYRALWSTGGCGDSATQRVLKENGWLLTRTVCTKTLDAYQLSRI